MEEHHLPARGRRAFLLGAVAALATACTGGDDDTASPTLGRSDEPPTDAGDDGDGEVATVGDDDRVDTGGEAASNGDGLTPLVPAQFDVVPICGPTASAATGPFPNLRLLDRRDITEDRPGHPLRLGIRVVDQDCSPVPGAEVEIWHADATGDYSSYEDGGSGKDEGDGTTFMRGLQVADGDGIIEFQTIYPGWYGGRAVHIHATVRTAGGELTTQLYFDEAYTDTVHTTGEYATFGPPDTGWDDDGLIGSPEFDGTGIVLAEAPTARGPGTLGLINLGLRA